jgi:hypothetical protein
LLEKWTKDRCVGFCLRRETLEEKKNPCLKIEHNIRKTKLLRRLFKDITKFPKQKLNYPLHGASPLCSTSS